MQGTLDAQVVKSSTRETMEMALFSASASRSNPGNGHSIADRLEFLASAQIIAAQQVAHSAPDLSALEAIQEIFLSPECGEMALETLGLDPGQEAVTYWDSAAGLAKLSVLQAQAAIEPGSNSSQVLAHARQHHPAFS